MQTVNRTWNIFKGAYSFNSPVPATADAYNEAAKDASAVLEDAIAQHGMHNFLGKARSTVAKAVEKAGHARQTEKKGDKEVYTEGEDAYIQRLLASGALTKADLASIAEPALAEVTFISTLGAEGSSRAAIGTSWLELADEYIAAWEAGVNPTNGAPASAEISLGKWRAVWPAADLADPTNREEVARLLRDFDKVQRKALSL